MSDTLYTGASRWVIFDDMADSRFDATEDGRRLFLPHGVFGSARVLPDAETEAQLRRHVKREVKYALPAAAVAAGILATWGLPWIVLPWLLYIVVCLTIQGRLVSGLPILPRRRPFRTRFTRIAASHRRSTLRVFLGVCLFFAADGLFLAVTASDGRHLAFGGAAAVVFGAFSLLYAYVLRLKDPERAVAER